MSEWNNSSDGGMSGWNNSSDGMSGWNITTDGMPWLNNSTDGMSGLNNSTDGMPRLSNITDGDEKSGNCNSSSTGVYNVFNMCLVSSIQHVGFAFSFIAIALWFASHFLILRTNHQDFKATFNRLFFTLHRAAANLCNLLGCLLSNQIGTMVLTAIYFLVMDVVFIGQYFYYVHKRRPGSHDGFQYSNFSPAGTPNWKDKPRKTGSLSRYKMNGSGFQVLCIGTTCFFSVSYLSSWLIPKPQSGQPKWSPTGRVLLGSHEDFLQTEDAVAGYVLGVVSSLLYCAYKIPEVISMIFANMTYVLSILAYDKETGHVVDTLPWTIGSILMIGFDLIILYHILKYKRPKQLSSKRLRNSPGYHAADLEDAEDLNRQHAEGEDDDVDSWVQMGDVGGSLPRIEEEEEDDEERYRVVDMANNQAKVELVYDDTGSRTQESELTYHSSSESIYLDTMDEPVQKQEPEDLEWDESDISRTVDTSKKEELCDEDVMAEIERELGMTVEDFLAADSETIRSPRTAEFMRESRDMEQATENGQLDSDGEVDEEGEIKEEVNGEDNLEEFWQELNIMKA
ncbi:uncharacterized protein [Antedon mediterranea]|uniref:uncharacterized protein isoform X2 n=1 Tax=Antedon mediterranea TaxID=105859 RepID=UPI003AF8E935